MLFDTSNMSTDDMCLLFENLYRANPEVEGDHTVVALTHQGRWTEVDLAQKKMYRIRQFVLEVDAQTWNQRWPIGWATVNNMADKFRLVSSSVQETAEDQALTKKGQVLTVG